MQSRRTTLIQSVAGEIFKAASKVILIAIHYKLLKMHNFVSSMQARWEAR